MAPHCNQHCKLSELCKSLGYRMQTRLNVEIILTLCFNTKILTSSFLFFSALHQHTYKFGNGFYVGIRLDKEQDPLPPNF